MKVFGLQLNVLIRDEDGMWQVLCSQDVLKKLIDAFDIQEHIWVEGEPHQISSIDFTDLEEARLGYDLFVMNLTVRRITRSA
ncbi:hypothetical protein [Deinococcus cellulosilyticus]|uniref:Uncharacterized protein n=1 Tax=Deinococcus cellulosilyticus (strain DSM 18568 / NBRC 106333 / KACC 11606 / 5516J-15) TaxID=1223518 RepID=A0A511N668_DEIC1|nr:hypothetical protein [Deinococcus cellulosilyticus]GEM48345.1 hypothetical protein DC3_39800 [Deinococcus cellulosilyticus NBRC 106333 = KACC 11606]